MNAGYGPWKFKYGDIYEIWEEASLVQIDDQGIDFDNSTRGVMINYDTGKIRISHLNGNTKMIFWIQIYVYQLTLFT